MGTLVSTVWVSFLLLAGVVEGAAVPQKKVDFSSSPETTGTETVIDIAASTPFFHTLLEAIKAADLLTQLSGPGPYTIFAPNDAAFAKLGPDAVANLLKPANRTKLRTLLAYHIVPQKVLAADLHQGKFKTLTGDSVTISGTSKSLMVDDAKVLDVDMVASNGVIHIIDTVLSP